VRRLAAGPHLARRFPRDPRALRGKRRALPPLLVRVIRDDAPDPKHRARGIAQRLVTPLVDESAYPARELVPASHERGEIENAIDEIDPHPRAERPLLRSHKPAGVAPEVSGLLLAHYAARQVMAEAATQGGSDPDCLSFGGARRLIRAALPELDAAATEDARARRDAVLPHDVARERNPPRRARSYPRVVKRKMSTFKLKRPALHGHQLQTTPFIETVRIC
jgi:hypothetical protein